MMQVNWRKEINSGLNRMYRATVLTIMIAFIFPSFALGYEKVWTQIKVQPVPNGDFPYAHVAHTSRFFSTQDRCEDDLLSEKLKQIEEAKVIEKHDTRHIIKTLRVPNTDLTVLFEDYQCLMITVFPVLEGE